MTLVRRVAWRCRETDPNLSAALLELVKDEPAQGPLRADGPPKLRGDGIRPHNPMTLEQSEERRRLMIEADPYVVGKLRPDSSQP